jgi:hypothetical protein
VCFDERGERDLGRIRTRLGRDELRRHGLQGEVDALAVDVVLLYCEVRAASVGAVMACRTRWCRRVFTSERTHTGRRTFRLL